MLGGKNPCCLTFQADAKKGKKLSYEFIISAGNTAKLRNDNNQVVYTEDGHHMRPQEMPHEVNRRACQKYHQMFEQRNPNMRVVRTDWHADEFYVNKLGMPEWDTAHLHLEFLGSVRAECHWQSTETTGIC